MPAFTVLSNLAKRQQDSFVTFDPQNAEHMAAYVMLTNSSAQRGQHPKLRFHLEHPYLDVISMMNAKIGRAYIKTAFKTDAALMSMVGEIIEAPTEVKYIA